MSFENITIVDIIKMVKQRLSPADFKQLQVDLLELNNSRRPANDGTTETEQQADKHITPADQIDLFVQSLKGLTNAELSAKPAKYSRGQSVVKTRYIQAKAVRKLCLKNSIPEPSQVSLILDSPDETAVALANNQPVTPATSPVASEKPVEKPIEHPIEESVVKSIKKVKSSKEKKEPKPKLEKKKKVDL